ncbi:hypothetical protein V6478_000188 [Providencia rettgeri]|nr:hypothetical protein [Providencia rettgeri]EHZ7765598.1 hypothetical protein [Providencia rettgeri]EIJ7168740.1 hypothetical protein [Providencia rettgeri]EJD6045774.1 hypothetical protein [Providencia rettgeri]EJD6379093.1 hypothetical protein [Providencia rettgeri]EJD6474273.1 hypothetical protein [Providencia rettgeri]
MEMKTFGVVLTIIGLITAIISYNMDVSIPIVYGESVKDSGLAFDRQNYIIGSLLIAFFGILIVLFDNKRRK